MLFNKNISGFANENEFAKYLNGRKVGRLSPLFTDLIYKLYGYLDLDEMIECWVNRSKRKADIYIKINSQVRGISIKKGIKNSVHVESLNEFIFFLKELGIEEVIINEYLKYHFADGTIDGTGTKRLSSEEYRKIYQSKIDIINEVFNNENYIDEFINRFVLQGNKAKCEVDAIIYGVVDDFIWITNSEVKYILKKHLHDSISSLHISCLSIQPMGRNLNYNKKYEYARYCVQIKWYNLVDQIVEVMSFYRK